MKPLKLFTAGLLVVLVFLSGCAFDQAASGKIVMRIPDQGLASSRSIGSSRVIPWGEYSWIQVYLIRNGSQLPIGQAGESVLQQEIPESREIALNEIDAGTGYALYVALGNMVDDTFRAGWFGESAPFTVTAEIATPVTVPLETSPEWLASGSRVSAVSLNGVLHVLADGSLTAGSTSYPLPEGYVANSLSIGKAFDLSSTSDEVWVNTNRGIVPFRPEAEGFKMGFMTEQEVFDSGALSITYTDSVSGVQKTENSIFYQAPGTAGGAWVDPVGPTAWVWTDMQEELASGSGDTEITDMLDSLTTDILLDYEIHDTYAYFVPAPSLLINPARVGTDVMNAAQGVDVDFAWVKDNVLKNNSILIDAANTAISSVSQAGTRLYAGTNKGIYQYTVNATSGVLTSGATLVPETMKFDVVKLKVLKDRGDYWLAAITRKGSLVVFKNNALVKQFRYFSGIPQNPERVLWHFDPETGDVSVVVTGSDGAAKVPAFTLAGQE